MSAAIVSCDECGADVLHCDNNVLLDVPAAGYDESLAPWRLMSVPPFDLATAGGGSPDGKGHVLHAHQPPEAA